MILIVFVIFIILFLNLSKIDRVIAGIIIGVLFIDVFITPQVTGGTTFHQVLGLEFGLEGNKCILIERLFVLLVCAYLVLKHYYNYKIGKKYKKLF